MTVCQPRTQVWQSPDPALPGSVRDAKDLSVSRPVLFILAVQDRALAQELADAGVPDHYAGRSNPHLESMKLRL
jgi:hypothetical protein